MRKTNPPLDAQSEKLLKQIHQLLDELLAANTDTALSVVRPRLRAAVDRLAQYRYAQIGVMEPRGTKR